MADNDKYFRDILGEANRANVSFYPIDPRGLPAMETDINEGVSLTADKAMLQTRLDSMRVLASNTDGVAFLDSNDLRGQMRRLAADFTSYYLLGIRPRMRSSMGGFRTIKVRVSRPGVEVGRGAAIAPRAPRSSRRRGRSPIHPSPRPMRPWTKSWGCSRVKGERRRTGPERAPAPSGGRARHVPPGPVDRQRASTMDRREFSRTERLHIEMLPGDATAWTGALLDRTGKTLPVPVATGERADAATGQKWLIADLTLAPLGAGDYAIELTLQKGAEPVKILKAIRVTQ